ncbi:MAG: PilZ domain-containing protein [Anaerolineaceae bacterium]|nr:PilZ domain-containing protein [Anaerolineaceae bacterium]
MAKKSPVDNSRSLRRRHLIYYLRVFDLHSGKLMGHLVDITTEGVMLISEYPSEVGLELKMRMVLPFEILDKNELVFDATCVWCKKDINPDFYAMGFQILEIPQEDLHIIEDLIAQHGFQD